MITLLTMPEDRLKADKVLDAMVSADLTVWGETAIPGGDEWSDALVRAEEARCLVVCWSEAAIADNLGARLFREAALNACSRGKTIGVLFDRVSLPTGFACTIYDLSKWRLEPRGWRKLLIGDAYLRDIVAAAKFKQANRDPAPPSAPSKLFMRQVAVLSSAIIVPLIGIISFTDVLLNYEQRMALQPSSKEAAAWNALPPGDCAALRSFVREFKDGAYRSRAYALLGAVEKVEKKQWKSLTLEEDVYLPHSAGLGLGDAQAEGTRRCELLVQGTGAHNLVVSVSQVRQDCRNIGDERFCDWRGVASCSFEEPGKVIVEICNM